MKGLSGRFNVKLSFEPQNIRDMSLDRKRDCMDELENRRKLAAKYALLFLLGMLVYYFVKNYYNLLYIFREGRMPDSDASPVVIAVPAVIALIAFFADILKARTVVLSMLLYAAFAAYLIITSDGFFTVEIPLAAFSLAGLAVCYNLLEVCEAHDALMKEEGYPDFFSLPTKDEVNRHAALSNSVPFESPNAPTP